MREVQLPDPMSISGCLTFTEISPAYACKYLVTNDAVCDKLNQRILIYQHFTDILLA
jgi:hypothetical protein